MKSQEDEYEVESILEAKVEKAKGRSKNPKLVWKYRVRWKGYSSADDTWEPIDSFEGSEHIVSAFWERANTGGRNVEDMTQFRAGDVFRPVGPPKRKSKHNPRSSPGATSVGNAQVIIPRYPASSGKRGRDSTEADDSPPRSKRLREDEKQKSSPLTSSPSHGRRPPSPEVIPDSDEEMEINTLLEVAMPKNEQQQQEKTPDAIEVDETLEAFDPLFDEPKEKIPDHIARKENPLVKMVVETSSMTLQGAIAAKARVAREPNIPSSSQSFSNAPQRVKPGPGRSSSGFIMKEKTKSSLLTAEKGAAKIIKGKYKREERDLQKQEPSLPTPLIEENPVEMDNLNRAAPSGDELLELAGLDTRTAHLDDFEESAQNDGKEINPETINTDTLLASGSNEVKELPSSIISPTFPQHNFFSLSTPQGIFGGLQDSWKQSTIFGPLSLGSDPVVIPQQQEASRISLNLDSAMSIPALFVNATSSNSEPIMASKGAPGKFYSSDAALTLLSTLRAGGLSAQVIVEESATAEEKEHFKHFRDRLQTGDIFVAIAGVHILVFCSSDNSLLSQRLNMPPTLQTLSDGILVSRVEVENYSGYADATSHADERRWIQYIATVS